MQNFSSANFTTNSVTCKIAAEKTKLSNAKQLTLASQKSSTTITQLSIPAVLIPLNSEEVYA